MSIALDVHNVPNSDEHSLGPYPLQRDGDLNIFDEIEHLLNFNQNLEYTEDISTYAQDLQSSGEEENPSNSLDSNNISTHCNRNGFLANDNSLEEDAMLFIVEKDGLQPFSSKFVTSGIYKKIPSVENTSKAKSTNTSSNVYYSEFESNGRIVTKRKFQELYALKQVVYEAPPCKLFLMESTEDDTEPFLTNCSLKPKCNDTLNHLASNIVALSNQDNIVVDHKRNEIIRTEQNAQGITIYRFLDPQATGLTTQQNEIDSGVIDDMAESSQSFQTVYSKSKLNTPLKRKLEHAKSNENMIQMKQIKYSNQEELNVEPSYQQCLLNHLNKTEDSENVCSKPLMNTKSPTYETSNNSRISSLITKVDLHPKANYLQDSDNSKPQISDYSESLINSNNILNINTNSSQEVSLFQFLIGKLHKCKNVTEDHKVELFLDELNDFVHKLQSHAADLIRSTSGEHFVNSHISNLLCIPEGQYTLDLSALETPINGLISPTQTTTLYSDNNKNSAFNYTNLTMGSSDILTDKANPKLNPLTDDEFRVSETNSLHDCYGQSYTDINRIQSNLYTFEQALTPENLYVAHLISDNGSNASEAKHMLETFNIVTDTSIPQLDLSTNYF